MVKNLGMIWVELRFRGRSSVLEMPSGGRPLFIGSGLCSDLRIDCKFVAMVHLELVRSGDEVWLWVRGDGEVRSNAARVGESCRLPERAVVEFSEHELEILTHTKSPPNFRRRTITEQFREVPPVRRLLNP
jgi:hypothetical protein